MSITLDTTKIQSFSVGATVVESNNTAAITNISLDLQTSRATIVLSFGTFTNGVFTRGASSKDLFVTIDGQVGVMAFSDGRANVTLTAAQKTSVLSMFTGLKNNLETTLLAQSATLGTQVT